MSWAVRMGVAPLDAAAGLQLGNRKDVPCIHALSFGDRAVSDTTYIPRDIIMLIDTTGRTGQYWEPVTATFMHDDGDGWETLGMRRGP